MPRATRRLRAAVTDLRAASMGERPSGVLAHESGHLREIVRTRDQVVLHDVGEHEADRGPMGDVGPLAQGVVHEMGQADAGERAGLHGHGRADRHSVAVFHSLGAFGEGRSQAGWRRDVMAVDAYMSERRLARMQV